MKKLENVNKKEYSWFALPVNVAAVPDYLDYVDKPMDLGSIKKRKNCEQQSIIIMHSRICLSSVSPPGTGLDAHEYTNCVDFLEDLQLVFKNALTYNVVYKDIEGSISKSIHESASRFNDEVPRAPLTIATTSVICCSTA